MSLKSTIEQLATGFAAGVLAAIRQASLEDILAESGRGATRSTASTKSSAAPAPAPAAARKRRGGRLARRSPEQIAAVVDSIVSALQKASSGLRSEQLQKTLGLDKKEITGPLNEALSAKKIRKTGQKRSTTYFAK
jgi:hypothetical protein